MYISDARGGKKAENSAVDQMTYYLPFAEENSNAKAPKHYKVAYEMWRGKENEGHCVLRFIDRDLFFVKMRKKREESQRAGRHPAAVSAKSWRDDGGATQQDRKDKSKNGEIREE